MTWSRTTLLGAALGLAVAVAVGLNWQRRAAVVDGCDVHAAAIDREFRALDRQSLAGPPITFYSHSLGTCVKGYVTREADRSRFRARIWDAATGKILFDETGDSQVIDLYGRRIKEIGRPAG